MLINENTKKLLDAYATRPSSSLIIKGGLNDGVDEIINSFCEKLLGAQQTNSRVEIKPDNEKSITIEQARFLKKSLQTKLHSATDTARIGIVWRADTATREAQNALLKLIEEPVEHTVLLLQCDDTEKLLSTVRSRCQLVSVLPIEKSVALEFAKIQGVSETEARKAYTLSKGKSVLYVKLLQDAGSTPENVITAKNFLQETVPSRLQRIKEFDDSNKVYSLLEGIDIITHSALQTPRKDADKFYHILSEIRECKKLLSQNALVKLVFLRLCVNL